MSANPSALVRLMNEFLKAEPDAVSGGIYAAKGGYHNSRANHLAGRSGGKPGDYSVQAAADKRGPSDKAAAVDITFNTARRSDFRVIAKYTKRVIAAMKAKDKRLYHDGRPVWREVFGNSDLDRQVEGYSLYRGYAVSSDDSHLWHMHFSCHREFVENWAAVSGMLDVLLDRDEYVNYPGAAHFKLGNKSDTIGKLNYRLKARGAKQSREFTASTVKAYRSVQLDFGYTGADADGYPGRASWDRLKIRKDTPIAAPPAPKPEPVPDAPSVPVPAPAPAPAPAPSADPAELDVPMKPAQLVRQKGEPAVYAVGLRVVHIVSPEHLSQLREQGWVSEDIKEISKAHLAELLRKPQH